MVLTKKIKFVFTALVLQIFSVSLFALQVPALKGRVNDYAGIISQKDEEEISQYLESLENTTGAQLAVLTIPSLEGEDISSFGLKVCEKWQLGRNGQDDGALLLVALKEHQVRIEVGYGLEGKLTDTKCGLIIRNVMIPEFKNGNYSAGISKGIMNMGGIASDNAELISKLVSEPQKEDDFDPVVVFFVIIWFMFVFCGIMMNSKHRRRGFYVVPGPTFHNHSSSFGGFGGGSSFGGGFHGGGGHFGGGGASGHW